MYQNNRPTYLCALLFLAILNPCAAATLRSGDAKLVVEEGRITIDNGAQRAIQLDAVSFNYTTAKEWRVAQADTDKIVVLGRFPAAADFYNHVSNEADLTVELTISKQPAGFRFFAQPQWGRQVTLDFRYLGDHFFGLSEPLQPDNRLSPDLTGASIAVDIASEGESLNENYATAYSSLYLSSFGYGAFFDTFARGRYEFAINGRSRIHHDTGTLDWHLFFGHDGREIHRSYFRLIGRPKPVPAWGLGPIGWRDQNDGGAAEIVEDVERMNALRIPFTSWFVDRPYSDGTHGWSEMNFGEDFREPERWIAKLREDYGVEFMTWVAPATFGDVRFPRHLAGKFSYLDLSHPETVATYQERLKKQHDVGVKGHKIDRADEGFPLYEDWHDMKVPIAARRNEYAYLMAKIHDDVLEQSWQDDQITFARTAIHRTQPYLSAIWGGDPRTSWEGLRSNFANAARSAFMAFPVWGTDVGGYQGEGYIPEDLYIRWMQAGSMTGLFEIKLDGAGGEGQDRMPWRYDDDFQQLFRAICEDRIRLIPYLYSLARTSAETGTLMQPLAYRHLDDERTFDNWDQFYVGDGILVAPMFGPGTQRRVYLPEGDWHDFDDPARHFQGGRVISVEAPLEKLPRFVKANSLYVSGAIYRGNDRLWETAEKELVIHAFPGRRSGSANLFTYIDMLDGDKAKPIELVREKRKLHVTAPAFSHRSRVEIALERQPNAVNMNGRPVEADYDEARQVLSVRVDAHRPLALELTL